MTIPELCQLYKVSRTSVYKWIYAYSDLEPGLKMESEASKTKQLLERNAELERFIGQKQLEIEYLQKTLELASAELGYDIKKVRHQVIEFFRKGHGPMSGTMKDLYLLCGISRQGHVKALQKEGLWQDRADSDLWKQEYRRLIQWFTH